MLNAIEDRYKKSREAIRKATKTEITVFRDLFLKSNPDVQLEGRAVVAADLVTDKEEEAEADGNLPTSSQQPAADDDGDLAIGTQQPAVVEKFVDIEKEDTDESTFIPPDWALKTVEPDGDAMSDEELKAAIAAKVPFDDNIDIWELLNVPGARAAIIQVLNVNLPEGIEKITASPKYADHIIWSLVTDSFAEDHTIPTDADLDTQTGEYSPSGLPPVPRELLALIHELAEENRNDDFDVNRFWKQVRQHFPELPTETHGKPTAASLLQQGQAAVLEEELAVKAWKMKSTKGYERLLEYMKVYKSAGNSSDESGDPQDEEEEKEEPGELTLNLGAGLDTTIGAALRLEMKTRSQASDIATSASGSRRKRTAEEEKSSKLEFKKFKGDKKKAPKK